jgi:hypothetical protein
MSVALLALTAFAAVAAQPPSSEQTQSALARLSKEADLFDRNAHRFTGIETLRQIQPEGTRFGRGPRGIVTKLPEAIHEIVSEYGYISADEPGGSLKEIRLVLTIDGLQWKKGNKELKDLANQIGTRDSKNPARTLESYENYGLRGFLSDSGQLILLFSRGAVEQFEFTFDRVETGQPGGPAWAYKYQQIDGPKALTIYGNKEPIRQRLRGEVWFRSSDAQPLRITIDSNHMVDDSEVRDITVVEYDISRWGLLLPVRINHRQYVDSQTFVIDEFSYRDFRMTVPGTLR